MVDKSLKWKFIQWVNYRQLLLRIMMTSTNITMLTSWSLLTSLWEWWFNADHLELKPHDHSLRFLALHMTGQVFQVALLPTSNIKTLQRTNHLHLSLWLIVPRNLVIDTISKSAPNSVNISYTFGELMIIILSYTKHLVLIDTSTQYPEKVT